VSRPDEGVDAIYTLMPGAISGPLSAVWSSLIDSFVDEGGYQVGKDLIAAPYDWRLAPFMLETRDEYFMKLKNSIETAIEQYDKEFEKAFPIFKRPPRVVSGVIVIAHSMGNAVFRYFLEWLSYEMGAKRSAAWIDEHIKTYVAAGPHLLGAPEGILSVTQGVTFGLPISNYNARQIETTFSSTPQLFPFDAPKVPGRHAGSFPHPVLKVRYPTKNVTYSAADAAQGVPFRDMTDLTSDPWVHRVSGSLQKFYHEVPLPLTLAPPPSSLTLTLTLASPTSSFL
jgi:hypothetical protein